MFMKAWNTTHKFQRPQHISPSCSVRDLTRCVAGLAYGVTGLAYCCIRWTGSEILHCRVPHRDSSSSSAELDRVVRARGARRRAAASVTLALRRAGLRRDRACGIPKTQPNEHSEEEKHVHCGPGTIVNARLNPSAVLGLKKSRFDHLTQTSTPSSCAPAHVCERTHPSSVNCASVGPAPAGPVQLSAPHPPVWQFPSASHPVRPQMRPDHVAPSVTSADAPAASGNPPVSEPSAAVAAGKKAGSTW